MNTNVADRPETLAREAKELQVSLKEALKQRDPWEKEVDFQRKRIRWQYLRLILLHPYANESKDVETHLWMQTSYAFISIYKQRIAVIDRAMQSAPRHQPRAGGPGPVEHRKILQRFRQFLAEEDKFWTLLLIRLHRLYALEEVEAALVELGILPITDESARHLNIQTQGIDNGLPAPTGRSPYQFPPEDSTMNVQPQTPAQREGRLGIASKALICLGDISRYRELYNESGGRPKAGHEDGQPSSRRGRKKNAPAGLDIRTRNYEKAENCYKQARLLVPHEGNASHQLAILASYQKNIFASIFHYYRSLCVRAPYDTASENLATVLHKALDQWKIRMKKEKEKDPDGGIDSTQPVAIRHRVETFKERVILLHAFWRWGLDKMHAYSPKHTELVLKDFSSLVSERHLPDDTITDTIVLAQGALWKHRMIRDSPPANFNPRSSSTTSTSASATTVESHIATHVLALHRALLDIGLAEMADAPMEDTVEKDLAQRITAPFRRTLPALRVAGKWLRVNLKYVVQNQQTESDRRKEQSKPSEKRKSKSVTIDGASTLWNTYSRFANALLDKFPNNRLLPLTKPLAEDLELKGFLPLKKLLREEANAGGDAGHPNEEHVMRISDLLEDAKAIAAAEGSPIILQAGRFAVKDSSPQTPPDVQETVNGLSSLREIEQINDRIFTSVQPAPRDDDAMTDDPVDEVFRQVLDSSEDEDDDKIIWDPRAVGSPITPIVMPLLPSSPPRPVPVSPIGPSLIIPSSLPHSPPHSMVISPLTLPSAAPSIPATTTAQDLLNDVLRPPQRQVESTAPQPQLLFGSGPPNLPGHSIWSTSLDNNSIAFQTAGSGSPIGHPYHSPSQSQFSPHSPHGLPWPSSSHSTQNSQEFLSGTFPSAPFAPQPHSRLHASSLPSSQAIPHDTQNRQYDSFGYPSSIQQPHIQRPHGGQRGVGYTDSAMYPDLTDPRSRVFNPLDGYDYAGQIHRRHDSRGDQPFTQLWGNAG